MAEHIELGKQGEYEARLFLIKEGYTLLEKNWRDGNYEIDIIAERYSEIVFVEVKTRRDEKYATAYKAVDLWKKRNLIIAARCYISRNRLFDRPYRYDIITVIGKEKPFKIEHIENAFTEQQVWDERKHRKRDEFQV